MMEIGCYVAEVAFSARAAGVHELRHKPELVVRVARDLAERGNQNAAIATIGIYTAAAAVGPDGEFSDRTHARTQKMLDYVSPVWDALAAERAGDKPTGHAAAVAAARPKGLPFRVDPRWRHWVDRQREAAQLLCDSVISQKR